MIEDFFNLLYWVMIFSIPLSTLQHFLGYGVDSVTAFFSEGRYRTGGNAGLNMFMCLVTTYYLVAYFCQKCQIHRLVITLLSCGYLAALAELKMYYFELIIIMFLVIIYSEISTRKVIGSLIGILMISVGMWIYSVYYGERNKLDFESMLDYAGATGRTYGSYYSLNRLTAVPYVWKNVLDSISSKVLGFGAGYADNITTKVLSSGFIDEKTKSLGFHLFPISLELTNLGVLGLALLLAFYISIYFYAMKMKTRDKSNEMYYITAKIVVVLVFVSLFYNNSIFLDTTAPFIYFILAIPFSISNEKFAQKSKGNELCVR